MSGCRSIIAACLFSVSFLVGCGSKELTEKEGQKTENQEHEETSGAAFKAGKGVILTDETKQILGVESVDIALEKLARQIKFTVQIYGPLPSAEISNTLDRVVTFKASGSAAREEAAFVNVGQQVQLRAKSGASATGIVFRVHPASALGETEIDLSLVGTSEIKAGEFLTATITLPRTEAVIVIPRSALLSTSEGHFVYAVNGEAYYRTPVQIGAENSERIEITDGLLNGDQIVTKPVETLWLIELRATKGGGHFH